MYLPTCSFAATYAGPTGGFQVGLLSEENELVIMAFGEICPLVALEV